MLSQFMIVHRLKPGVFTGLNAPIWSTCLRSLAFVSPMDPPESASGDEVYSGKDAYRFLLEIVCGLHSPIVGETEVFGQFKAFSEFWVKEEPHRQPLIQKVFSDAKSLRHTYLSGLGTQSYGGWIKRRVRAPRVHFLGGGQLAMEILPYLKKTKDVVIHVRRPEKLKLDEVQVCALSERAFDDGELVVAAPMTAAEIEEWLSGKTPTQCFDLRETAESDALSLSSEGFTLQQIFREIEATKSSLLPIVKKVRDEIERLSEDLARQAMVRPLGWDDLCA